ncbi:MAG: ATP-binding protein [Deltaproteobacteria bacterium]|nr:ATP-binding protein [Deltaproteobacteria bacterium]
MTAMVSRRLALPARSFFLLGPRGTGKTTWLRAVLPEARWFNLLSQRELTRLLTAPGLFRQEVDALPDGTWVVVDEVQRLPALLDEVHDVLSGDATRVRFALTASSARKLRAAQANLLAGRALSRRMFPLVLSELGGPVDVDDVLRFGGLPGVRAEADAGLRGELLEAYRDTYLVEEIRNEGLVRSLDAFARFLDVAALMNAQVLNVATTARDAGVSRTTVLGYFQLLVDTMVGVLLQAWRARARVKETAHPKFYLFDTGVARTLAGRGREALHESERGALLETWVLHELRAWQHDAGVGGDVSYWRVQSGLEVDFVWQRGTTRVGIEVKASHRWRAEDSAGLLALDAAVGLTRRLGVYLGERRLKVGSVEVFPVAELPGVLAGL